MHYQFVGRVVHYFDRIRVAVVVLEDQVYLEEWLLFEGAHTELEQQILSMQIDHAPVDVGHPGEEIAIQVDAAVRVGDEVFLIMDEQGAG